MGELRDILVWFGEQESILSGIAACLVIIGVLFSPLGAGLRRFFRARDQDGQPASTVGSAESAPQTKVIDTPSIAVLPFASPSGAPADIELADGLAGDILTGLSRVKPFIVIGRNATLGAGDQGIDVQRISRDLGVRYVLEGNVRQQGERVRVGVQLVDATTLGHVWAESYERPLGDPFSIQDELKTAIVAALQPELRRAEAAYARKSPPEDLTAWSLVNLAWVSVQSDLGSESAAAAAAVSCERALELDPDYALAHAVLGHARSLLAAQAPDREAAEAVALSHARRGLSLGSDDPLVQHCYATTMGNLSRTREGILAFERSLELDPNSAQTRAGLGIAQIFVGELEAALQNIDEALRLSPRDPLCYHWIAHRAMTLMLFGRYREAAENARDAVARANPRIGWVILATCLGMLGELDEGRHAYRELQRIKPELGIDRWEQLLRSLKREDVPVDDLLEGIGRLAEEEA